MPIGTYDEPVVETDRKYALDKKLLVRFYRKPILNESKSSEAGRQIYDEVDYIRIITPGSRDDFHTEVTDTYKRRFSDQWEKYQKAQDQTQTGTPLDIIPWLNVSQVEELKFFNIHTVEQLVGASDNVAQKFTGFHKLQERANLFLNAAAGEAEKTKLTSELAKRDSQIAVQADQIAALSKQMEEMQKKLSK